MSRIPPWAIPGAKCACVSHPPMGWLTPIGTPMRGPAIGEICTIVAAIDPPPAPDAGLILQGYTGPVAAADEYRLVVGEGCAYFVRYFRPLTDEERDLELFRGLLNSEPEDKPVHHVWSSPERKPEEVE